MIRALIAYVCTALAFAALDGVWLSLAGPRLYKPALGELLSGKVDVGAAVAFYVIYVAGLVFFAVWPALKAGGQTSEAWSTALVNGAVLGLVSYAAYDLTNQATLRAWSVKVTILDLCWGVFASALAATVSTLVTGWAGKALGR